MTLATTLLGLFRRSAPDPVDDGFGRRLGRIGSRRENLSPRFLIFRNLASRREA
ncbi:hypothetical protein [Szabonella alba]|uniref:Uncharacterized protein n=1 Tax=Szabonella alba TaxID=2804194 RepID=A0A8K0VAN8_9RHOB|nr:hypothetical protein [Szabonella alba]MBL4918729.1 hypothetical protein [Szabonella alba]